MDTNKIIAGLKDLIKDRKSFLTGEDDDIFKSDIEVLEEAIEKICSDKRVNENI